MVYLLKNVLKSWGLRNMLIEVRVSGRLIEELCWEENKKVIQLESNATVASLVNRIGFLDQDNLVIIRNGRKLLLSDKLNDDDSLIILLAAGGG